MRNVGKVIAFGTFPSLGPLSSTSSHGLGMLQRGLSFGICVGNKVRYSVRYVGQNMRYFRHFRERTLPSAASKESSGCVFPQPDGRACWRPGGFSSADGTACMPRRSEIRPDARTVHVGPRVQSSSWLAIWRGACFRSPEEGYDLEGGGGGKNVVDEWALTLDELAAVKSHRAGPVCRGGCSADLLGTWRESRCRIINGAFGATVVKGSVVEAQGVEQRQRRGSIER